MFKKWRRQSTADRVFDIINYAILLFLFLICIYPLYYVLIVSFNSQVTGVYLWPKEFSLKAYKMVLEDSNIWLGYANTIFYTAANVICSLLVMTPCAYALSRKDFVGRGLIMGMIMVTMFVSGGLIPGYLNMRNLGLLDSRWGIILSSLVSTYNVIVAKTFFSTTIPDELLEATKIDGGGNFVFFTKVVLPLSKPILAVLTLYVGVGRWNSYFTEMIYLRNKNLYPLTLYLRRLLSSVEAMVTMLSEGLVEGTADALVSMQMATIMQYCLIVVSTIPMMILYPFMQKYFAKGVMIGSVKG